MELFCSSDEEEIVPYLIYSTNGFSLFGSVMVLMTYIILPKLRKNWLMRYLAYLNISNFGFEITAILVYHNIFKHQNIDPNLLSSPLISVYFCFRYSSFLWPLILAINLYQIVAKRNKNLALYEFIWLFIGFGIPIIVVIILKNYGLILFYQNPIILIIEVIIPVTFMVFFSLLAYFKLMKSLKFVFEEEEAKRFMKVILPYPLVCIAISIPVCVFNILYSYDGCFTLLSSILWTIRLLQGGLDAIVFCFNPTVRKEIRIYFRMSDETINQMETSMNTVI